MAHNRKNNDIILHYEFCILHLFEKECWKCIVLTDSPKRPIGL